MEQELLEMLKARLGISTDKRDLLLKQIIQGIIDECKMMYGVKIIYCPCHVLFVLDWATWKYNHPDSEVTPRSILFRLHNLIVKEVASEDVG